MKIFGRGQKACGGSIHAMGTPHPRGRRFMLSLGSPPQPMIPSSAALPGWDASQGRDCLSNKEHRGEGRGWGVWGAGTGASGPAPQGTAQRRVSRQNPMTRIPSLSSSLPRHHAPTRQGPETIKPPRAFPAGPVPGGRRSHFSIFPRASPPCSVPHCGARSGTKVLLPSNARIGQRNGCWLGRSRFAWPQDHRLEDPVAGLDHVYLHRPVAAVPPLQADS